MNKVTGDEILAVAAREIDAREGKGKRTKYGEFTGCDGQAWCVSFIQWVYHEAGADLPFKTASCGELLRWYQRNQPECIVKEPVPGCIVIFDWPRTRCSTDHTGLFVCFADGKISTIDGNTGGANDSNGGYVRQRTRALSYARPIYIIPRELEEEMKRYQTLDEVKKDAAYAAPTVEKLLRRGVIRGRNDGLDLSEDMLRVLTMNDRAGLYEERR